MIDTISAGPTTVILIGSHTNFAIFIMTHPQLKKTWSTYTLWMVGWDQRTLQVAVQKMLPHHVCQSSVVTMVTCLLVTLRTQMQNSTYLKILSLHIRYDSWGLDSQDNPFCTLLIRIWKRNLFFHLHFVIGSLYLWIHSHL